MRFSVVLGYKDRDADRLARCLQSLANQQEVGDGYEVVLADFGSAPAYANAARGLCEGLSTSAVPILYRYLEADGLFFNRSAALNYGAGFATGEYLVFGDIDLIYPPDFLAELNALASPERKLNYRCYLATAATVYEPMPTKAVLEALPLSQDTGLGLSVVARAAYLAAGGYEEYYCLWGVEDLDFNDRCLRQGLTQAFAPATRVWTLHQWHPHAVGALPRQWYTWLWEEYNRYKGMARPPFSDPTLANARAGMRPAKAAYLAGTGWSETLNLATDLPYALARLTDAAHTRPTGTVLRVVGQAPNYTSALSRVAARANGVLARMRLGYRITPKEMADFELEPLHKMRDAVYYTILQSRPRLADYYIAQSEHWIEAVVVVG